MSTWQRRVVAPRAGLPLLAGAIAALLIAGTVVTMVTAVPGVRGSPGDVAGTVVVAPPSGRIAAGPTDAEEDADSSQALVMPSAVPVRLHIPSIDVDTSLIPLGLQEDGTLDVPPSGFPAGWFAGAPTPGELGPAIIVGHVDWARRPGVFFDLWRLSPGDRLSVVRDDGSVAVFRVTEVRQVAKDEFPTQAVYGDLDHAGLRLITCGGTFDRTEGSYADNLIIFAVLVLGDAIDRGTS
jgi:sortase (surface protein transpeptidase)